MFIVVEGPDGVGKGTQVTMLVAWLKQRGLIVWETREPTDGEYGRRIRRILDKEDMDAVMPPATEFQLLYTRDRSQHALELREHLGQGEVVVCDRYYYSTFAYGAASGADVATLRGANNDFPIPDVMLWLNVDSQTARGRMEEGRAKLDEHDENLSFQDRLQLEYHKLVAELSEAVEIDGVGEPEAVHQRIVAVVEERLELVA